MPTTYTKIAKATGTVYSPLSGGKTLFNDQFVLFDQPGMPFDGADLVYTKIAKATGTSYTKITKAT